MVSSSSAVPCSIGIDAEPDEVCDQLGGDVSGDSTPGFVRRRDQLPHDVEVVGRFVHRCRRRSTRRRGTEVRNELHPAGALSELSQRNLDEVCGLDRMVHRLEVVAGGSEVAAGRHHVGAAGRTRQPQHDARIAAGVADHRDALACPSFEVRARLLRDPAASGPSPPSAEAHVAVGIDEARKREPTRQFLGIRCRLLAPSVHAQPGVLDGAAVREAASLGCARLSPTTACHVVRPQRVRE